MTWKKEKEVSMFRQLAYGLFLSSTLMVCQAQPQNQEPSITTVQSIPESDTQAQEADRPIEASLQEKAEANDQIQTNLQSALDDDPILADSDIAANVDDVRIVLTGTVPSYRQHQRVLELVSPYSDSREIVDKLKVQ
jgi:osmotically-inducible protein OsmY